MFTPPEGSTWTVAARWVFPVSRPPLANGTVRVRGELIEAVEPAGKRQPDLDLGEVAIVPGFVNAHTHLDLSGLRDRCPPDPDFTEWLRQVVGHRRQQQPDALALDIATGIQESLQFGTTLLGDISAGGASWQALDKAPLRSVVFHEVIGLTAKRASMAWDAAEEWLQSRRPTKACRPGLSPHAPYSVRTTLLDQAAEVAKTAGVPLALHLAESRDELELLAERRGPFVKFLTDMGVWDPSGLVASPAEVIKKLGKAALYVHGNYLEPALSAGINLVYCPRTHAAFRHDRYPLAEFLAQGARIALGTDGLASSPDLDVLAEARLVRALHPDVSGATILRMATLNGAEMLGFGDVTGSLEAGKSADMAILRLEEEGTDDPYTLIFNPRVTVGCLCSAGACVFDHLS